MQKKKPEEKVVQLKLSEIHPFKNHPFSVRDDEKMNETVDSISKYGVLMPAIVRTSPEGGYEMIAGQRRHRGSELAGLDKMPCIVREVDDDTATVFMVDSNIHRDDVLPSELAKALKMKMEAVKRLAGRAKKNSPQVAANFRSDDEVGKDFGISGDTLRRYVSLTNLEPEILSLVDEKKIGVTPASHLAALLKKEQKALLGAMEYGQSTPSLSQAQRMKKLSAEGELTSEKMKEIMSEEKKSDLDNLTFSGDMLRKYFPRSYTPKRMQETILRLLETWQKKRQRQNER